MKSLEDHSRMVVPLFLGTSLPCALGLVRACAFIQKKGCPPPPTHWKTPLSYQMGSFLLSMASWSTVSFLNTHSSVAPLHQSPPCLMPSSIFTTDFPELHSNCSLSPVPTDRPASGSKGKPKGVVSALNPKRNRASHHRKAQIGVASARALRHRQRGAETRGRRCRACDEHR